MIEVHRRTIIAILQLGMKIRVHAGYSLAGYFLIKYYVILNELEVCAWQSKVYNRPSNVVEKRCLIIEVPQK